MNQQEVAQKLDEQIKILTELSAEIKEFDEASWNEGDETYFVECIETSRDALTQLATRMENE